MIYSLSGILCKADDANINISGTSGKLIRQVTVSMTVMGVAPVPLSSRLPAVEPALRTGGSVLEVELCCRWALSVSFFPVRPWSGIIEVQSQKKYANDNEAS